MSQENNPDPRKLFFGPAGHSGSVEDRRLLPPELRGRYPDMNGLLEQTLDSGERIVWSGVPDADSLRRNSMPLMIFGCFWTFATLIILGFAFTVFKSVSEFGLDRGVSFFGIFLAPFLLAGAFMIFRPLAAKRKAFRTIYAVTDRRLVILEAGKHLTTKSLAYGALRNVQTREREGGIGDIYINNDLPPELASIRQYGRGARNYAFFTLIGVQPVQDIEKMIWDAKKDYDNRQG